jgi:diguanylate cyclase (GGDEF)-like protein
MNTVAAMTLISMYISGGTTLIAAILVVSYLGKRIPARLPCLAFALVAVALTFLGWRLPSPGCELAVISLFVLILGDWWLMKYYWGYLPDARIVAVEGSPFCYMVFNARGHCIDCNRRALFFFQTTGNPTLAQLAEKTGTTREILESGNPWDFVQPDETGPRYYRLASFPVQPFGPPNSPLWKTRGRCFLISDITDYKEREQFLTDLANHDILTRIPNRRYLTGHFADMRREEPGTRMAMLMIDIDHFKTVNDVYGHLAGDDLLKAVAARCKSCLRNRDVLCRYGGDEFLVLLLKATPGGVLQVAERLIQAIGANPIGITVVNSTLGHMSVHPLHLPVTISVGTCSFVMEQETDLQDVIARADKAMYESKQRGGNQISLA